VIIDCCYLDNRQGSYNSKQVWAKPRELSRELVALVNHVCTQDVRDNRWRDVPERRQLNAYCHWDKYGNRIDKPTWIRRHVALESINASRIDKLLKLKTANIAPVDWLAHTADGLPPDNWHITRHWRTTYPIAFDYLRRVRDRSLQRRALRMFLEVKCAAKIFDERKHDETDQTEEPLRRKAA
jgi:hypothetical protein